MLPPPEPLDRICLGARHLQLAVPRARAERGRGLCGGGAPESTQRSRPAHAAGPAPSRARQPMPLRDLLLCKSAGASVFIEKSTQPAPPPAVGAGSFLQIVCPISLLCEQESALD